MNRWFFWDPDKVAFTVPILNYPIVWYGVFFALGFLMGFYILLYLFKRLFSYYPQYSDAQLLKHKANEFAEKLTFYIMLGTVIGARLGHILFYEKWTYYLLHPIDIIKIWEGGLASHGAVIGILVGVILFYLRSQKEFFFLNIPRILDLITIPALIIGTLIRIGNFINQEVLGTISSVPWAVIFGHPIDGGPPLPRHPAQLYEALFYFVTFFIFLKCFARMIRYPGKLSGFFFIVIFTFRFFIEFLKEEQSQLFYHQYLKIGQVLSIPMIIFGLFLFFMQFYKRCQRN